MQAGQGHMSIGSPLVNFRVLLRTTLDIPGVFRF